MTVTLPAITNTMLTSKPIVQQNGEMCVHFIIQAWNFHKHARRWYKLINPDKMYDADI